jgi:predicted sulfurtransferase
MIGIFMVTSIVNIAGYKFVYLTDLEALRTKLYEQFVGQDILGTILLGEEGINLMLAGTRSDIDYASNCLRQIPEFADLTFKESFSAEKPYDKFKIKIKTEIVRLAVPEIDAVCMTAPTLAPQELKQWLDEDRDFLLLDTRNNYEVKLGTFDKAIELNIRHFRTFQDAIKQLPEAAKEKPLVMFCTGGIRCEKAAPFLVEQGFKEVYQLEGGILNYFKECGDAHYNGNCFIFDHRTALTPQLEETGLTQCERCQEFVTAEEQALTNYKRGDKCIYCRDKVAA